MEYESTYLDDEEIQMDQRNQNVEDQHFMGHEAPSLSEDSHHGVVGEEELLAAQAAADAAVAQQQEHGTPGGVFSNVGQGLVGKNRDMMMQYWQEIINSIEHDEHDFKNHQLPLARIKKVMKTDEDVRMISAEAPILFAKGCDVFITELTMRAWIHAEENKRRTLQKSDIAAALTKSDMFDFLIDVVPREEERPKKSYRDSSFPPSSLHHPMRQGMMQHGAPTRNMGHLPNSHLPNSAPNSISSSVPNSHLPNSVQNSMSNSVPNSMSNSMTNSVSSSLPNSVLNSVPNALGNALPNQLPERTLSNSSESSLQNSHGQPPSLQHDKIGGRPEPQPNQNSPQLPFADRTLPQNLSEETENLENQPSNETPDSEVKPGRNLQKVMDGEQKDGPFFESYPPYENEY